MVVIISFTWLGMWQLSVSRSEAQTEALTKVESAPPTPIQNVMQPHTPFTGDQVGRRITANGTYDAQGQVLVAGRRLGQDVGYWVLTPMIVQETGVRLPVVRGFTTSSTPPAPPEGQVYLEGALQPQEGPPDEPTPLPPGQVGSVDLASLVNVWEGDLYNGFVIATAESPDPADSDQIRRIPPPGPGGEGIVWRNFAYAIQWWIFAAFAVYMWWRMVRDDYESSLRQDSGVDSTSPVDADHTDTPSPTGGPQR